MYGENWKDENQYVRPEVAINHAQAAWPPELTCFALSTDLLMTDIQVHAKHIIPTGKT